MARLNGAANGRVLCPTCKIPMVYMSEAERVGGETRITRYYVCPACKRRIIDEKIIVNRNGDKIILKVIDYRIDARPAVSQARKQAGRTRRRQATITQARGPRA